MRNILNEKVKLIDFQLPAHKNNCTANFCYGATVMKKAFDLTDQLFSEFDFFQGVFH